MNKKIVVVAGARPNFMKIASIVHAIEETPSAGLDFVLVHTGQHYDKLLSDNFFEDLRIPNPNYNLAVGSGSHAKQTAEIMVAFEGVLQKERPDLVLVVGDVNSTMACTLTAKKMNIKVAHIEAGIRSFDLDMPEEINRMVTDSIADYFFTTTQIANTNLRNAGAKGNQIFLVGNTMIDTLISNQCRISKPDLPDELLDSNYAVLTLHRPSNVDSERELINTITKVMEELKGMKAVFPVHPRTAKQLKNRVKSNLLVITPPMRYLEFIYLIKNSSLVITDSGGIQEETTYLNIPCITLRKNTERPETIDLGTNVLANMKDGTFESAMRVFNEGFIKNAKNIPFWDGKTGKRIVDTLSKIL